MNLYKYKYFYNNIHICICMNIIIIIIDFKILNMPINVFGNISNSFEKKLININEDNIIWKQFRELKCR